MEEKKHDAGTVVCGVSLYCTRLLLLMMMLGKSLHGCPRETFD